MALINSKEKYIMCAKCGSKEFTEREIFTLENKNLRKGTFTVKRKFDTRIFCANCNSSAEESIKYEIIG